MLFHSVPGAALWPAAMIVWGPGRATSLHRHHCVQLVMALRDSVRIRGGSTRRWTRCQAALIRADADHEVDARGTRVLIAYVDLESALGEALSLRIDADIFIVPPREVARWRGILQTGAAPGELRVERWLMYFLLQDRRAVKLHPGVSRVLRHLRANLGASDEDFSLPRLARLAGLSQSRFMHVFTQSTHVALRPYVLWLRLQRGCGALMSGSSITEAAHRAGFADAAHMSRTFRRMLGTTPRQLSAGNDETRGISLDVS